MNDAKEEKHPAEFSIYDLAALSALRGIISHDGLVGYGEFQVREAFDYADAFMKEREKRR